MPDPARLGLVALLAWVLSGCATGGPPPAPSGELDVVRVSDIKDMLDAGRPLAALEAIDTQVRTGGEGDAAELSELRALGLRQVREQMGEATEEGRTERMLSLGESLRSLGEVAEGGGWEEAGLLAAAARKAADTGLSAAAAAYGFRLLSRVGAAGIEEADRTAFFELLRGRGDPAALEQAQRLVEAAGLATQGERAEEGSNTIARAISGTVTVLVDKGLKVQNRVGTPDRVLGSGFFVDPSGYIMTNHHVISSEVDPTYEGFSRLYVMKPDRPTERIPARVVGYDEILDLAILKAEVSADYVYYPGLEVGLRPGDQVIAIGSPASLESTVNSGIVSAVGRRFLQIGDVMQIDVPVNPGNSGGPLLDSEKRVVGIVFAGLQQYDGLNFAIPSRWIGKMLPRLYDGGQVAYAWLGASVAETEVGLEVVYAIPGGPAARVGLREGDVLERVGGRPTGKIGELQGLLMEYAPPVLMKVEWRRGSESLSCLMSLDERPIFPLQSALEKDTRDRVIFPLFGMKIEKIGSSFGKSRFLVRRVLPGSQAAEIGLSTDDPVTIETWQVDAKQKLVSVNMYVTKKSSGYLEGMVQLTAYLETDSFL